MPRFQSKLFNLIDHSLPVVWGRQARRWLAELQAELQKEIRIEDQRHPTSIRKNSKIRQVLSAIQKFNHELSQSVLRIPNRISGKPPSSKLDQIGANPVGNFAESQSKLETKHQPRLISGAIAALVKVVSAIIRLEPNSDRLEKQWSDQMADPSNTDFDLVDSNLVNYVKVQALNPNPRSEASESLAIKPEESNPNRNQPDLDTLNSNLKPESTTLSTGESWYEKMQRLLQAAIAYFLAKDAQIKKLPADLAKDSSQISKTQTNQVLPLKKTNESSDLNELENWYDESYFNPQLSQSRQNARQLAATGSLTFQNSQLNLEVKLGKGSGLSNVETAQKTQLTTIEEWAAADMLELEDLGNEQQDSSLRAWIETQSVFLGYAYSPIMAVIHWCDRWMAKFEEKINSIYQTWQKFWQKLVSFLGNSKPPEA